MAGDSEVLQPLEFTDCLADSPAFRDNLQRHEKELERTSQQIKRIIKEVKDVVNAARRLSTAQRQLAGSMEAFQFACVGDRQTDDERHIATSLQDFAALIRLVEDERDRMLGRAHEQIIEPLERFRKEHIGAVKEGKKKFDKKTAKFCQTQERTLALSLKKPDNVFQEADAAMEMAERDFCAASLEYVCRLQALHERKKFELVETLLGFVFGWWTFHHTAHDVHADAEPRVKDLQLRIQRTRTNFEETSKQTESLMKKMMELRQMSAEDSGATDGRKGYLFLMEKKAFGAQWCKQWAVGSTRALTLQPYSQLAPRAAAAERVPLAAPPLTATAVLDVNAERRFTWEAQPADRDKPALLLQSLSETDRAAWLRALRADGGGGGGGGDTAPPASGGRRLDDAGVIFVQRLLEELEARGLREQGLYRVAGVSSRVQRLLALATSPPPPGGLGDPLLWETRTLASALKAFLRALPDGLLPKEHHHALIQHAKMSPIPERVTALRAAFLSSGPRESAVLRRVVRHLRNVAELQAHNLMGASNLAVVWGPTLIPPAACVASILELKFHNVLVETMIDHYDSVFEGAPIDGDTQHRTNTPAAPSSCYSSHQQLLLRALPANSNNSNISNNSALPPARPPSLLHYTPVGVNGSRSNSVESVSSGSSSPPFGVAPWSNSPPPPNLKWSGRVRTLYACLGEAEGELSFEPNQIITDVAPSGEPGWLSGALRGRRGLVPENYVEPLP